MKMYNEMKHKTAIITGGSTGIGKSAAKIFAENGVKICIADIQEEKGKQLAKSIKSYGHEAIFIKTDVSIPRDVKNMVDKTIKEFGSIDYAFNNAGIEGEEGTIDKCSIENWDKVINVNLKGVWLCMKYELEEMSRKNKGIIVNTSSIAGKVGFANLPAYVASKHGVNGLTKNAALEYAKNGIRVNSVCPGVIKTEMVERVTKGDPTLEKQFASMAPMERMGTPDEIGYAVVWLCSDQSSFLTGQEISIDGGYLAQ